MVKRNLLPLSLLGVAFLVATFAQFQQRPRLCPRERHGYRISDLFQQLLQYRISC